MFFPRHYFFSFIIIAFVLLSTVQNAPHSHRACKKKLDAFIFSVCGETCQGEHDMHRLGCHGQSKLTNEMVKELCCPKQMD